MVRYCTKTLKRTEKVVFEFHMVQWQNEEGLNLEFSQ